MQIMLKIVLFKKKNVAENPTFLPGPLPLDGTAYRSGSLGSASSGSRIWYMSPVTGKAGMYTLHMLQVGPKQEAQQTIGYMKDRLFQVKKKKIACHQRQYQINKL